MSEKMNSLKFTPIAIEDLDQIYSYISEQLFDAIAAGNLMNKIESSVMRLKTFPYSCSYVTDEVLKSKGYRKLIVDNYIVFYLVDEAERQVIIARILYGAQKYEDLL